MLDFASMMKRIAAAAAGVAAMSLASTAGAATLSTGVGLAGATEPNWALTGSPGSTSLTIVSGAQDYPGAWVIAPLGSNWITPYAAAGTTASDALIGEYDYSLSFANPGAPVSIQWSSDNGAEFFLNGASLSTVSESGFGALVTFLIPAASFSAGVNTFLVKVDNSDCGGCANPTGLLVSATLGTPVPLPSALPLFASGIGALGLLGWRKRKQRRAASAE